MCGVWVCACVRVRVRRGPCWWSRRGGGRPVEVPCIAWALSALDGQQPRWWIFSRTERTNSVSECHVTNLGVPIGCGGGELVHEMRRTRMLGWLGCTVPMTTVETVALYPWQRTRMVGWLDCTVPMTTVTVSMTKVSTMGTVPLLN